ncbi:MAG TPA: hypothetical protein PK691_10325, partial [Thermomicrobiales bacterium]|nr:hypothetical protein [Thermomicrobiales bacterium]
MRVLVVLICILAMFLVSTASSIAQAPDAHTYTVHLRECPAGYSGDDPFGTCHGRGVPGVDLSWFPDGPAVSGHGTTDDNGDITFTYDAALLGISMDAVPFNLLSTYVYCIDNATNEQINADGTKDLTGILFKANSYLSTDVTCDWYLIPPTSGPEPTVTTGPGSVNFSVHLRECPAGYTGNTIYDTLPV